MWKVCQWWHKSTGLILWNLHTCPEAGGALSLYWYPGRRASKPLGFQALTQRRTPPEEARAELEFCPADCIN